MKIKYFLTAFLLMALNSSVNSQDEFKFVIQEQPISCTASIFGGVHTCSQSLLAFAYNIPNKNGKEAHFTCYVSWYYWVKGEGKQVTKEIIVQEKAQIFAGSAKAKLNITEVLNTTKQAQQPVSRYNCEILY